MAQKIGLEAVFDTRQFSAGLGAYISGIGKATGVTQVAGLALGALDNIATGFLRRIGSEINKAVFQFASNMVSAAADASQLGEAVGVLNASLAETGKATLTPLFNEFAGLVSDATPAILGFVQTAEQALAGFANDAVVYGEGIVNSLAAGMWAAVDSIVSVLSNIGNLIAYYLMPGSPPRLLPDLDTWGTDAMNVYLGGWAKGDFGIFNEVSNTLENLIKSMPVAKGSELGVIPSLLGTRQGIAEAVEELRQTGEVSKETIDSIVGAVGTADNSVRSYLESMIALEAANDAVAAAQANLTAVTAEYDALLKPVDDKLDALDESQKQMAEDQKKSLLALVLQDPNASAADKRRAALELERIDAERAKRALITQKAAAVDAAKAELEGAEKNQDAAQDKYDAQKALLGLMAEQNKLVKEQMALIDRLNKPAAGGAGPKPKAGGGGGFKPQAIAPDFGPVTDFLAKLQEKLAPLQAAWNALWASILATMQPAIDAWNNDVVPAWNRLVDAFQKRAPEIQAAIAEAFAVVIAVLGPTLVGVFENVGKSLDALTNIVGRHGDTILAVLGGAWRIIVATVGASLILLSGLIAIVLTGISSSMNVWSDILRGDWNQLWVDVQEGFALQWGIITDTLAAVLEAILASVGTNTEEFKRVWSAVWNDFVTIIDTKLQETSDSLTTNLNAAAKFIEDTVGGWAKTFTDRMGEIKKVVDEKLVAAQGVIEGVMLAIGTAIAGPALAWSNFVAAITGFWDWLTTHVFNFKIEMPNFPSLPDLNPFNGPSAPISSPSLLGAPAGGSVNNYNYSPTYQGAPATPQRDFAIMRVFGRR